MKVRKPQSKRVPVRLRESIKKASSSKQRKQRKEAKKNPQWRSRLKKDPGIPNLFPQKGKVLAEIEDAKRRKEEEAQNRRDIAKAQRRGKVVEVAGAQTPNGVKEVDEDEELIDGGSDAEDMDGMDVQDDGNPMAALLASAQQRVKAYDEVDEDEQDTEDEDEDEEWTGIIEDSNTNPAPGQATRKVLPKQALADPIKAVTALLDRMQNTTDGIQCLVEHYGIPPLVTAGSDVTTRFLVEVARKTGRLGKRGVPNLHSAALTVLSDMNEERLILPSVVTGTDGMTPALKGKGEVTIVRNLAEPFRIEGLYGGSAKEEVSDGGKMILE